MIQLKTRGFIVCGLFLVAMCFSCKSYKYASYFNDLPATSDTMMNSIVKYNDPLIKPGDLILFNITTLDELSTAKVYSAPVTGNVASTKTGGLNIPEDNAFLVNKAGEIEFPLVGIVKVSGVTLDGAKELLRAKFSQYYKTFSLYVAFANHHFTILGEVGKPGTYPIVSDKVGLFDAIGLAGDLSPYAKRDQVLLIRDTSDDKKHLVRLNLNSKNILSSPYYYLKENDIIYIEPTKEKLAAIDSYRAQNVRFGIAALTIIILVLTKIKL